MAIGLQFLLHHPKIADGIISTGVDDVDEQPGALDVTKKIVPQTGPLGCTGNESRNIGENRAITTGASDDAKIGYERCEGVVGDLGASGGQHSDQGALARIGQADDAHLSQELQFQLEWPFLPIPALGEFLRSTVAIAEVVGIAQTAATAERHGQPFTRIRQIPQQNSGGEMTHLRPARHLDHEITPRGARALVRTAAPSIIRSEQSFVLEVEQGLKVAVRLQHHRSAMATISAGGSTGRHIFLASKRGDAISAAPPAHRDPCLIDELHGAA